MPALVPMIDMLVILVVYMLVHTSDYEILPNTKNIAIPESASESKPHESTVLMITRDQIYVDGQPAARVADVEAGSESAVHALQNGLMAATQRHSAVKSTDPASREVTVMADKGLPYSLLKTVMAAATSAEIGKMSLAVIQKERSVGPAGPG